MLTADQATEGSHQKTDQPWDATLGRGEGGVRAGQTETGGPAALCPGVKAAAWGSPAAGSETGRGDRASPSPAQCGGGRLLSAAGALRGLSGVRARGLGRGSARTPPPDARSGPSGLTATFSASWVPPPSTRPVFERRLGSAGSPPAGQVQRGADSGVWLVCAPAGREPGKRSGLQAPSLLHAGRRPSPGRGCQGDEGGRRQQLLQE